MNLNFLALGTRIKISHVSPKTQSTLSQLQVDLEESNISLLLGHQIEITLVENQIFPKGPLTYIKPGLKVFGLGATRYYQGPMLSAEVVFTPTERIVFINAQRNSDLYWFCYLLILASLGEWLEEKHWLRLHAVSWKKAGKIFAITASENQGKSFTAKQILDGKWPGSEFQGEEIFWTNSAVGFAYPNRISLRGEESTPPDPSAQKIFLEDRFHKWALNSPATPELLPLGMVYFHSNKLRGFAEIIFGLGLPQMTEHLLRAGFILRLLRLFFNRCRQLLSLLRRNKIVFNQEIFKNPVIKPRYVSAMMDKIQGQQE